MQKSLLTGLAIALALLVISCRSTPTAAAENVKTPGTKTFLSPSDLANGKSALEEIEVGKWNNAKKFIGKVEDPITQKIFAWLAILDVKHNVPFDEARAFAETNPKWPSQNTLQGRVEESMMVNLPHEAVLAWFETRKPVTTDGLMRLGAALLGTGQKEKAVALLRQTWREGNFGRKQERQFYQTYRQHILYNDHVARLDRLIWEDRYTASRRMLNYLRKNDRYLPEARLALMHKRGGVDKAVSKVPSELKNDPGIVYERLRWRRRKGRYLEARELLENLPQDLPYPHKWWQERSILAREALKDGHITETLRLIGVHGLSEGAAFAEAEWLAGWVYLRFLEEPEPALKRFTSLYEKVKFPISEARAAYWAGRAAEALNKPKLAQDWYKAAAVHPTTYYGQLSIEKRPKSREFRLPPEIVPTASEQKNFMENELVGAIYRLKSLGLENHIPTYLRALDRFRTTPGWRALTASLAAKIGHADQAVVIAKKIMQEGQGFVSEGYPVLPVPGGAPEAALVLAVIRQESAFATKATSHAGARGLMQIMPQTAARVAKAMQLRYSKSRLVADPDYNLSLGRYYLADLVEKYDGSYVLALAAYNAGPSRTNQWIKEYGDPRDPSVDPIDWVEKIPFKETRNYVQRVLENLNVYRAKFGITQLAYEDSSLAKKGK